MAVFRDYTTSAPPRELEVGELLKFVTFCAIEHFRDVYPHGPTTTVAFQREHQRYVGLVTGDRRARAQLRQIAEDLSEVTTTHAVVALTAESWMTAGMTAKHAASAAKILTRLQEK